MLVKILVVDDSAADTLIIKNMLEDYCVLTARDGVEAMQVLAEHEGINLLILDLNMPNMNGFQVLEALQKDERYRHLRTIILTNYDELENEIEGLRLGAVDYIRKPVHLHSLKARIDVHIALLRAEAALRQRLEEQTLSFDTVFDQAPIGIAISYGCDPQDTGEGTVRINPMYEQITGRTKEELIKLGWAKITHPDDLQEELALFRKLQAGEIKRYSLEKRFIRPDGSVVWVSMNVAALALTGTDKLNYMALVQDISERKQIELERKYMSEHDRWTGLYNRDYLVSLLEQEIKQKKGITKALIGINLSMVQLLTVNYGFQYTQNLIKKAAEVLSRYCTANCLLFQVRESGFVFYLFDYAGKHELVDFSRRIAQDLESLFVTERIGGGIGIIELEPHREKADIELLLRSLLIASERSIGLFGEDFAPCFYDEEFEALVNRERDIREALAAVAADDKQTGDELFLQYQPILNLKTGRISGFEALARLRTAKLGPVPPVEFIPIAEKTKLIVPIGEKVIVKAFQFLKRLREHGYDDVSVTVNISFIQLLKPDFTARLFELINRMQVDPASIGMEITESVFASDYEHINHIIEKLRNAGLQIAIDDFGTGYSSLARVKGLQVTCVKIDKYFVDRALEPELDKVITSDIISMAHKLGYYTIAEGVEYASQLEYLKKHGCDRIQGYLISRPLDEDDAIRFLQENTPTVNAP